MGRVGDTIQPVTARKNFKYFSLFVTTKMRTFTFSQATDEEGMLHQPRKDEKVSPQGSPWPQTELCA